MTRLYLINIIKLFCDRHHVSMDFYSNDIIQIEDIANGIYFSIFITDEYLEMWIDTLNCVKKSYSQINIDTTLMIKNLIEIISIVIKLINDKDFDYEFYELTGYCPDL